jgi:SAM-dependent methyltransferase
MRNILKKYANEFKDCKRVLDIACGKGEFLSLAKEAGINAIGIDNDASIVEEATKRGLTVYQSDVFEYLEKNVEAFDGIFCSQFIEHLNPDDLLKLLALIYRNLKDDGIVIVTTPNPQSIIVHLESFYKDFSHVRFYDLDLVKFMMGCTDLQVIDSGFDQDTAFSMPLMRSDLANIQNELSAHKDVPMKCMGSVPSSDMKNTSDTIGSIGQIEKIVKLSNDIIAMDKICQF